MAIANVQEYLKLLPLTREMVVRKLEAYLHHQISLDDLVAWASSAMMEADFEEVHYDASAMR